MIPDHHLSLDPVPPPDYRGEPAGVPVSFPDLVARAHMRNVVTMSVLPDIRIHDGDRDFIVPSPGHRIYCIGSKNLPDDDKAWAREILRRLAYGCFEYASREIVARYARDVQRQLKADPAQDRSLDCEI